jgi:hypothetical protein
MTTASLPQKILDGYEAHEWRHALAILQTDFPAEWKDLCEVLQTFQLRKSFVVKGGGNKSDISKWFDVHLNRDRGWREKKFETSVEVDGQKTESPTHSVDCFKNRVALEIEWNNKDPFYDRDLNNFRLLFDLRVISVGVIITRSDALQTIFDGLGRGSSYGMSTTHMSKLLPKIEGGGAGGCPVLIFGIREALYVEDC